MRAALEDHTVLLIGANGGIGGAIAHKLGHEGAHIFLAARDQHQLYQLSSNLRDRDIPSTVFAVDIRNDNEVRELIEIAAADGMGIAINNTGTTHQPNPLARLSIDDIDRVLQVNLRGTMVAMKYELANMSDGGVIVNVASTAGLFAAQGMAAYSAAKHGVIGLTRTASADYAARGIRINAVAPGPTNSGGVTFQPDFVKEQISSTVPLARLAAPEEIAAAVTWLATPSSSYTTGAILTVDGGKTARGA